MERIAINALIKWKDDKERKPLILKGADVIIGLNQRNLVNKRV